HDVVRAQRRGGDLERQHGATAARRPREHEREPGREPADHVVDDRHAGSAQDLPLLAQLAREAPVARRIGRQRWALDAAPRRRVAPPREASTTTRIRRARAWRFKARARGDEASAMDAPRTSDLELTASEAAALRRFVRRHALTGPVGAALAAGVLVALAVA